jgi:hypothetical protein
MRSLLPGVLMVLAVADASAQATWVVDQTPILDIAGSTADGTVVFGYPAGGMRLSTGELLIADRVENNIRVFDATGKLIRTVGRAGQGPGEFRAILWAGRCGPDSLLVWDYMRRQASMIGASGAAARQFAIPSGDSAQTPLQFSCSARGSMVYRSQPRPVRGAAPNVPGMNVMSASAAVYRATRDGSIVQRLGDVAAGEMVPLTSPSGGRGAIPRPLGRTTSFGALDDVVVLSSADSASVTIIRNDGPSSRHALPITLRAPTRAEFDEAVRATASMVPAPMRQSAIEQLSGGPMVERISAASALVPDSEGLLWIQVTPPGGNAVDFLVMQATGNVVARARIPRGLTVFDIGGDYILGSYTDSGDETHVAMYRLRR